MILHCYYCALGGDHPTEASQVAIVDNLHKPLTADMFRPLRPEHDPSPPFQSDEWRYMLHRACGKYPWPYDVDPVSGPSRILTDEGMVDIPSETFKVPVEIVGEFSTISSSSLVGIDPSPDEDKWESDRAWDAYEKLMKQGKVPYADRAEKADGIVKLVREQNMPTCGDCGKVCKSNAGLVSHMRTHKGGE